MTPDSSSPAAATRARPLSVEDRQAMIIDAVIPLLLQYGKEVTSKQIAEAAGVAEGTIFRAFGDKETLITAAVNAFMEGQNPSTIPLDPDLSFDDKLRALVDAMQHRVRDVMTMASIAGRHGPKPSAAQRLQFNAMISAAFDNNRAQLRVAPEEFGDYVRMLAIASTIPTGSRQFTADEIVQFIKHGVMKPTTGKD